MSTTEISNKTKTTQPAKLFRQNVTTIAGAVLTDWVGEEKAKEAVGRVSVAISSVAASAKDPKDFYECTPSSIAAVVAISALTGIMPGNGAGSLAYVIPRRDRKGEPPKLRYQLSHRGINALANRAGYTMVPVPVSNSDKITIDVSGEVSIEEINMDNPPASEEEFRGIVLVVKNNQTGHVVSRNWVPKKTINERRAASDSYNYAKSNEWAKKTDPWHKWYVEMAMKTAMHYAIARGWCVIDDTNSQRALTMDVESDLALPPPQGASKLEQLSELLGSEPDDSGDVIEVEAEPAVSEFAPKHDETAASYVKRIRSAISSAVSDETLSDILETAQSYAGSEVLPEEKYSALQELAAKRLEEIEAAKANGQLV